MQRLLVSLRLWLAIAMLSAAAVGVATTSLVMPHLGASDEQAQHIASIVSREVAAGLEPDELGTIQSLLPDYQVVVIRDGREVFTGPAISSRLEGTAVSRFPGGEVIVRDFESPSVRSPLELLLASALPALLVIVVAVVIATVFTRAITQPIERAIEVADRIAGGDLTARMGTTGPEEFQRLGRTFDSMAERLAEVDRNQRRFLADLAHEVATPVNTVSGFGLALADGSLRTEEERAEATQILIRETRRLQSLLDDLRRLTSLDFEEAVRQEPVEVRSLCREVAARHGASARARQLTLIVDVPELTLRSDRRLLDMVVDNLVSNAVRYTPAGGTVSVKARTSRGSLVVSVIDTGVGIPREHQGRVFERFYRVDAARDRATGGTGLGLSIALRAARALGGRIELDSEPGVGSEFRLVLPLSPPPASEQGRVHRVDAG